MLPRWLTAMFVLFQEAWSARRDAHIRFLKLQVEMLQSRLPGNRIIPDPAERRRLMKIGAEMGHAFDLRVMRVTSSILASSEMLVTYEKPRT